MRISRLHVEGYRSLRDVEIAGLGDFTVIYGDNNTGKSNVLAFLGMVFSRKILRTTASSLVTPARLQEREGDEFAPPPGSKEGDWIEGEIADFQDNFFQNSTDSITFDIDVQFTDADVAAIVSSGDVPAVKKALDCTKPLEIHGMITRGHGDSAWMCVRKLSWGGMTIYAHDGSKVLDTPVDGLSEQQLGRLVSGVREFLDESVVVITSHRYLADEIEKPHEASDLRSGTFKNSLHNLSLSREGYSDFAEIARLFAKEPFAYGQLSFARADGQAGDNLEVMVQTSEELRIPIDRLGSGVQQILFIIANLVAHKGRKIFGLEEPEINLAPGSQTELRNKLKEFIKEKSYVHQLLITSHSDIFGPECGLAVCHLSHDGTETIVTSEDQLDARLKYHFGYKYSPKFCMYECPIRPQIPKHGQDEACWKCREHMQADGVSEDDWKQYRDALPEKFS